MIKKKSCFLYPTILLLCLSWSSSPSLAQNTGTNESGVLQGKYQYYRQKLKTNFLVMGKGQGKSLPIVIRNRWGGNAAAWGDATIHLGWYLGVLSTEIYLLRAKNNQNKLKETHLELYYALLALQRLDNIAETHPFSQSRAPAQNQYRGYTFQNLINGYFSRDDVPANFVVDNSSLNESETIEKKVTETQSDWSQFGSNHEMSKDQVIHLLMGLKLVWKYLPNKTIIVNDEGSKIEVNFKDWSALLATQMIKTTMSRKKIINPVTEKLVKRGNLTNDIIYPLNLLKNEFEKNGNSSKKRVSASYVIWTGYKRMAQLKTDNLHMVMTLGSITPSSIKRKVLSKKANIQNWAPFYELLFDVIHNQRNNDYKKAFNMLVEAPPFGLKHNMPSITGENKLYPGWESPHRFIKNRTAQDKGWNPSSEAPNERMNGYFSGLDFMLLHNLYQIQNQ